MPREKATRIKTPRATKKAKPSTQKKPRLHCGNCNRYITKHNGTDRKGHSLGDNCKPVSAPAIAGSSDQQVKMMIYIYIYIKISH
jgi:hypothetical protein